MCVLLPLPVIDVPLTSLRLNRIVCNTTIFWRDDILVAFFFWGFFFWVPTGN